MGKYPYFPSVETTWKKKQKFDNLEISEKTTPSNPSTSNHKLYFKSDGKLYKLDSSGTEATIGGISTAQESAITANTAKVGITSSQASAITANTAKVSLTDNSVTLAKLAHGTADKVLGFDGSGNPSEITISGGSPLWKLIVFG